jgi:regulator of RNase E activity RraA
VVGCEDGVLVVPGPRIDDVLYQLEEVEACERDLGEAIRRRAPLEEIEAIVKRKKSLRQK